MKSIIVTGGHLTPALAVIKKLQEEGSWQILFIGRKHTMEGDRRLSVESQIIPKLGIDFTSISAGRIQRRFAIRYFLPAILKIPLGFFQSFYYIEKFHPDVILSFGGYLAVPVVLAGWLLGIPIITHEQSVLPGLATRFISLFAKKVAVSWKETLKYLSKKKSIFTGNPIRDEILKITHTPCPIPHTPTIYITGGNQGAHVINEVVRKCLPELLKKYRIIHQCGMVGYYQDWEKLDARRCTLDANLKKRYRLQKWFDSQEAADILTKADLVISRAGANIVYELAFLGKPAIFIPLPSGREQLINAKKLVRVGLAEILPQSKLTVKSLILSIELLMRNLGKYQKEGKQAEKLVRPDAVEKLIGEVKKCLKEG